MLPRSSAAVDFGPDTTVHDFTGLVLPGDVPVPTIEPVETATAGDFGWNEPDPFPPLRQDLPEGPTWRCVQCDSGAWREQERASWVCRYAAPTSSATAPPLPGEKLREECGCLCHTKRQSPRPLRVLCPGRGLRLPRLPGSGDSGHLQSLQPVSGANEAWAEARAESEVPTHDESVDPDTLQPLPTFPTAKASGCCGGGCPATSRTSFSASTACSASEQQIMILIGSNQSLHFDRSRRRRSCSFRSTGRFHLLSSLVSLRAAGRHQSGPTKANRKDPARPKARRRAIARPARATTPTLPTILRSRPPRTKTTSRISPRRRGGREQRRRPRRGRRRGARGR